MYVQGYEVGRHSRQDKHIHNRLSLGTEDFTQQIIRKHKRLQVHIVDKSDQVASYTQQTNQMHIENYVCRMADYR